MHVSVNSCSPLYWPLGCLECFLHSIKSNEVIIVHHTYPQLCTNEVSRRRYHQSELNLLTGFCGEGAHESGQEGVNCPQHFGVATGHASRNATLQGLEVRKNGWRLQHWQKEAENLKPCADVGEVGLVWLLLKNRGGLMRYRGTDTSSVQKFEVVKISVFGKIVFCSPSMHLYDQKHK